MVAGVMVKRMHVILGTGVAVLLVVGLTPEAQAANCSAPSTGLSALSDLGLGRYHGFIGGLYPGAANHPVAAYARLGRSQARRVVPRSVDGAPARNGRIVLLSIGMSNASAEFSQFRDDASRDPSKNRRVVLVDGAQGGADAERVANPNAAYWATVDQRLRAAAASGAQVQAVWLKEAIAGEHESFPVDARHLQRDLRAIVAIARRRFANLRLVYLASRTYAGYATTRLNPEPYAYQSAFAVRWLIGDRINHHVGGPWLGWGPYLWTDGLRGRRDRLTWTCADVAADGTHPSPSGRAKVSQLLLRFFERDPTAKPWFRG
jgi:hypothetical protein